MTQLVLITRPIEQAQTFADSVSAIGYSPLICPLLNIETISTSFEREDCPDAIIFSSSQAIHQLQIPGSWMHIPAYCVGPLTANAAKDNGFQNVIAGTSGIEELSHIIREDMEARSILLYLRGEHVHQDINHLLPNFNIREILTYRAHPIQHFTPQLLDQFDKINIVTLFSHRTGLIFKELIEKNALTPYLKNIKLLCLSPSVVDSVKELNWKECHIADLPNQSSMIEKLKSL